MVVIRPSARLCTGCVALARWFSRESRTRCTEDDGAVRTRVISPPSFSSRCTCICAAACFSSRCRMLRASTQRNCAMLWIGHAHLRIMSECKKVPAYSYVADDGRCAHCGLKLHVGTRSHAQLNVRISGKSNSGTSTRSCAKTMFGGVLFSGGGCMCARLTDSNGRKHWSWRSEQHGCQICESAA
jgi:hypothetical protein